MDLDEDVSPEPDVPPPASFMRHAFCREARNVFVTGSKGYRGGSDASGMSAGMRDEGMTGCGKSDSGAGISGPVGDELSSDINGPVALSWALSIAYHTKAHSSDLPPERSS